MKHSNLITIAIPYYQGFDYLNQAVDSVWNQTLQPAELIIIDNSAEGDATRLITHCPGRMRVVTSPAHLGLSAYFNQCLDAAQTPWCTIMHSDDIMLPDYIEVISNAAERYSKAAGVFCQAYTIDQHGRRVFYLKDWFKRYLWPKGKRSGILIRGENGLAKLLCGNFIMCPTMCYHLPVMASNRFDQRWELVVDLSLNGRLLLEDNMFVGLTTRLYTYRRHLGSMTSKAEQNLLMFIETAQCTQWLARKASEKGWFHAAAVGNRRIVCHAHLLFHVVRNLRSNNIYTSWRLMRRYIEAQQD